MVILRQFYWISAILAGVAVVACQQPPQETIEDTSREIDVSEDMPITPPPPPGSFPDSIDDFSSDMPETSDKSRHVHGVANLRVEIENKRLSVMLDSAVASLGIEDTSEDSAAITALQDMFLNEERIVQLPENTNCTMVSVSSGLRINDDHADLMVEQDFNCKNLKKTKFATLGLFASFPELTRVDAELQLNDDETRLTLTPADNAIPLK